ncbi:hypothetical protein F4781DRAFT_143131 [Annulohypoxylon bovei var. microspora]|nr:hypothetical protein F4781DRAFT_143131 [Annulohypoxylon bovei var. microspora]
MRMDFEMIKTPTGALKSLFNHIALPTKLPQESDSCIDETERGLVDRLIASATLMRDAQDGICWQVWDSLKRSLLLCKALNLGGKLERSQLNIHLKQLRDSDVIILHVAAQNAGIIIHKPTGPEFNGGIVFETFEASPKRESVLASQTLSWTFPGTAVLVHPSVFYDDNFLDNLSVFLEQASTESTQKFSEYAIKAGHQVTEDRENPHPALITSFLTAILEANGKRISPMLLRKRVRDDVCWFSNTPWRRLPYWLVLRVGIARHLATILGGAHGRVQYKFLMCIIHGMVLDDTRDIVALEDQSFLKAKLCRRLYKLDRDRLEQPETIQEAYGKLNRALSPLFTKTVDAVTLGINNAWNQEKKGMVRPIPPLPRQADQKELHLSLFTSREYLTKARKRYQSAVPHKPPRPYTAFQKPKLHVQAFGRNLLKLFDKEKQIRYSVTNLSTSALSLSARVQQLHTIIHDYIDQINDQYDNNVEQKSIMILTLMETWVALDKTACTMFPLLHDFHPVFTARLMEVLRLPLLSDISRARDVESYIQDRISRCRGSRATLFDDPCKGCFAERYFDESPGSASLANILAEIQSTSAQQLKEKEQEWSEMSAEYEMLTREYDSATCIYVQLIDGLYPTHDQYSCPKCQLDRRRSRMTIRAFESPLPENIVMAKAMVFELRCPEALSAYRDATWSILHGIAKQSREPGIKPRLCLQDYSGLQTHARVPGSISLASTTKSFLMTHYRGKRFPVDLDQVCYPNGLKLSYFDKASQSWPGHRQAHPTFEHHCKLILPRVSPFSSLLESPDFNVYGDGPSSYEIAASHSSCPSSLNPHEYMAFQYLLSGKRRRWITILRELGSSNLNLSTETTTMLLDHLAHQIGPSDEHHKLGAIHYVFRDVSFRESLIQQLKAKLEAIASNWRETHLMEIIIILALRLIAFTTPSTDHLTVALDLLSEARQITLRWVRMLRQEMYSAGDLDNKRNCQSYLLWAALLCKRTYASQQMAINQDLKEEGFSTFIECSATVYDNVPDNIASLGRIVKNSFVRDLRMMHDLKDQIRQWIERYAGRPLIATLRNLWPAAESKSICAIAFENDGWLQINLNDIIEGPGTATYNYIFGILLVDGQPLGRLPTDSKSTIILEELFGSQTSLMKYPSTSPGMTHALVFTKEGYRTHIGYDGEATIIRAINDRQVLELIPREIFRNGNRFDLPAHLIDNCIHWLDLITGILEIRSKSRNIWKPHPHNWRLDVTTSMCSRFTPTARFKETLVDPYSPLFNRVSKIFALFEHPPHLTVYQPGGNYAPTVEMPRMQLKWFVNKNNLLQSAHLKAEIDPSQSIDTWYGFDSKLVCRSLKDPQERFVLAPLGSLRARKRGCHVQVIVELLDSPLINYVRFMVNKTLGRIDCAPEPALVYKKAEIHALTSFVLADPLTGLTGVESSLAILTAGISQPWSPLTVLPKNILCSLSRLSPKREYYPEDLKVMKKETWDNQLPALVQREEFHILADRIVSQSDRLGTFHLQKIKTEDLLPSGDVHLSLRALRRRQLYERCSYGLELDTPEDTVYEARHDPRATSSRYANVWEIASIIRDKPMFMSTIRDLSLNLSQSLSIKGYNQIFEKITLHDRLDVDICREFGPLVSAVKDMKDRYKLMFFLCVISFRSNANMPLLRTLIAFAHWVPLQDLVLPSYDEYCSFRPRQIPQIDVLVKLIEPFQAPPPEDPPLMEFASSKDQRKLYQARASHAQKASADCKKLAQALISEWPTSSLSVEHTKDSYLIDVPAALNQVRPEWERIYRNHEFYIHLQAVQEILNQRHSDVECQRPDFAHSELVFHIQQPGYRLPTLDHNMIGMPIHKIRANTAKQLINPRGGMIQARPPFRDSSADIASQELEQIIEIFSESQSNIKKRYAADLKESLAAFKIHRSQAAAVSVSPSPREHTVGQLQLFIKTILAEIESAMEQPSNIYSERQIRWLQQGQLWPAITPITLLEQLRSTTKRSFGTGMKGRILDFALSITNLQRKLRMISHQISNEHARYEEERMNTGHSNWRVEDYPDWILLEVESNLLIRETQVEVALAIIEPESKANSVLQLNMGQGKTSCIIPMAAVLLADSKNLVRVSVPKSLLQTTAQLLHSRLGGLVGREISHVPFSRRTSTKEGHIKLFHRLHRDIQRKRGIMLCLPEHQMSFMLSGLQRVLDQEIPEASMMVRVQGWLQSCARDVLDESDHTLAVKTQLIYPSGSQMAVDGHPHRWIVVEQILGLMDMHLYELSTSYPYSIEVVRRPHGGFPFVFFLRPDVEEEMINRLRYDVCRGTRGIIPIDSIESADRVAIKEFLSSGKVRQSSLDRISTLCPDRPHVKQTIYLLRGLFVHRILIMALKKRYGVQYGLHPLRDPVAVPFHAKGVPSDQSEFGHVDVAILLTALAFYYCGISISQTRQALEVVLKSDDPASEYDKWTEDEDFPDYLRDWHSINVDDSQQMGHIWNSVRFKVPVIDYFMNNFVFPPHAKQFKVRLQSNGWDIPLPSHTPSDTSNKNRTLNKSRGLTTGFSGTNDIKPLLPLTIKQDDLPALSHTNAEVLTYLLQPRSKGYVVMADHNQKRINEISFLNMLRRHNIRILIDSGAQILEQSNKELAENWLKVDSRATVALYFEGDSPWILSKQGTKTPLLASPYADNLNEVLVYLDEAHTRGTDLKFFPYAQAALTLGLSQTKDHTVQAAMRLRQLGTTQSVVFFAPPEVNQSIRDICGKMDVARINSHDVIRWLISNTCDGIEQLQPLYYSQGIDYCNRMQAAEDSPNFLVDDDHRTTFINAIKHKERQTLQKLYGPQSKARLDASLKTNAKIAGFVKELESRKKTFQDTGRAVHASALQEVEQERETENEVEAVRQVKKPLPYTAHKFPGLHRDVEIFARTGRIPAGSDNFIHILRALARTALGRKYKVNHEMSSSQLFISREFERTVKLVTETANDNFMRPVQWILHAESPEAAIVVTPEEAEFLIQIIQETERGGKVSPTRLLTYAAPVTRRMMHFNKLNFYAIPPISGDWQPAEWLTTELGFFAGRLYFDWSEYNSICDMLGIDLSTPGMEEFDSSEMDTTDQQTASAETSSDQDRPQKMTPNPRPSTRPSGQSFKGLTSKPYTFTQEYLAVRRRGQDFTHTPMGFLCNGKPLSVDSPFFRRADTGRRRKGLVPIGTAQADHLEEGTEEMMDLGDYDPSAEIQDDEDHITIEYDESEMHRVEEEELDESNVEPQSLGETRGKRTTRRKGK